MLYLQSAFHPKGLQDLVGIYLPISLWIPKLDQDLSPFYQPSNPANRPSHPLESRVGKGRRLGFCCSEKDRPEHFRVELYLPIPQESFWWLDSEESQGHGRQMARYTKESTQWNSSQGIERAFPRPQIPQIPLRELFKSFKLRHCNLNILLQSVNSSRGILHLTTLTQ